ncbi:MAG TPA: flagellin [Oscillatoriaceae cyanobacterium]
MALRIEHQIIDFGSARLANSNAQSAASRLQRLSSGVRADARPQDGGSQAVKVHHSGISEVQRNTQECAALLQTAVGALNDIQSVLQRMRDLAAQATNDALTASQRSRLHIQLAELTGKVDRVAQNTAHDGKKLLDGSLAAGAVLPSGARTSPPMKFAIAASTSRALGLTGEEGVLSLGSGANAQGALSAIRTAIESVSAQEAELTSVVNGLRFTAATLSVESENASAAASRITDLGMATEVANAARAQILSQSATAMLVHAQHASQGVGQLVR